MLDKTDSTSEKCTDKAPRGLPPEKEERLCNTMIKRLPKPEACQRHIIHHKERQAIRNAGPGEAGSKLTKKVMNQKCGLISIHWMACKKEFLGPF